MSKKYRPLRNVLYKVQYKYNNYTDYEVLSLPFPHPQAKHFSDWVRSQGQGFPRDPARKGNFPTGGRLSPVVAFSN